MGTRVISAILTLKDKNFSTNMKKAASGMSDFERGLKFVDTRMTTFSENATQTFSNVAKKTGLITTGIAGLGAATGPAIAGVGAVGASFAAAGIGAAAFGAVAVSALGNVFEASKEVEKIEEQIANADSAKERAAAQKELAAVYADMSNAQKGALKDLQNFKGFWGDFVKQFEQPVFKSFSEGLNFTQKLLTNLAPTITRVSDMMVSIIRDMSSALDSSGAKEFFTWLEINAAESLSNFATITGNVFAGIFNIFQAFSPLGASVEEGLVSMTEKFQQWSDGLSESNGFQSFIEYAKTNGPVLMDTLSNIGSIIGDVVTALAPFGAVILDVFNQLTAKLAEMTPGLDSIVGKVTDFANVIINNWGTITSIILPIGAAIGALFIQLQLLSYISTIKGLMDTFKASTIATTFATQGFNAALRANPIGLVITLITLLVGAGVALYQNWDTVKAKAEELWAKTKEVFGSIYDWAASKIKGVTDFFSDLTSTVSSFISKITSFKMPDWVSSIGSTISSAASKAASFLPGFAVGTNRVPHDMVAQIHKDEMIIPARQSEKLRQQGVNIDNIDTMAQSQGSNQSTTNPVVSTTTTTSNNNDGPTVIIENFNAKGVTASEVLNEFVPMLKLTLANM
ncbi:hypothetical protein [Bacillus sp. JJ722]|uniref:hypothetical protein n=1 Tax=Bacillus sp. JJ722 TaxID=3122973 RepID=UPI002FFE473E